MRSFLETEPLTGSHQSPQRAAKISRLVPALTICASTLFLLYLCTFSMWQVSTVIGPVIIKKGEAGYRSVSVFRDRDVVTPKKVDVSFPTAEPGTVEMAEPSLTVTADSQPISVMAAKGEIGPLRAAYLSAFKAPFKWSDFVANNAVVGNGAYGAISIYKHRETGRSIVVKEPSATSKKNRASILFGLKVEASALEALRNLPYVVSSFGSLISRDESKIAMEDATGGNIANMIAKGAIDEATTQKLLKQMLIGYHSVHMAGFVHRDIKGENVLIDADGNALICDFGLARKDTGVVVGGFSGTAPYLAPEICWHYLHKKHVTSERLSAALQPLRNRNYLLLPTDIWSVGVLTFKMLSGGEYPFGSTRGKAERELYFAGVLLDPIDETLIPDASVGCRRVINRMLEKDPKKRVTISELLKDPWFSEPVAPVTKWVFF